MDDDRKSLIEFPMSNESHVGAIKKRETFWHSFFDLFITSAIIFVVVLFVRFFVTQPFTVVGSSMEPTLQTSDYIFIETVSYKFSDPKGGDIVVVEPPDTSQLYIKRIVAIPGESIEIIDGKVFVYSTSGEQVELQEEYISTLTESNFPKTEMKDGEYFLLGDNRIQGKSRDSRAFGPVHQSQFIGRAWIRVLPIKDFTLFSAQS